MCHLHFLLLKPETRVKFKGPNIQGAHAPGLGIYRDVLSSTISPDQSADRWANPRSLIVCIDDNGKILHGQNDWAFSQANAPGREVMQSRK